MIGFAPDRRHLRAFSRELRWRPLARRRLLVELAAHLEDSAADLRAAGLSADDAAAEAARRLGEPETVSLAFRSARAPGLTSRVRRLRSPAWIAVGAMSLVTAWAAELPQASGAKPTTSTIRSRPGPRPSSRSLRERAVPSVHLGQRRWP